LAALAACDGAEHGFADAGEDERIECRIGNAQQFERFCTVEVARGERGTTLTVRKPDGGFRRLLVSGDGRGVVAADGAEEAEVTIVGEGRIEVTIGGDTFRLPARVQGQ
jgi:hypothetical protein